MNVPTSHTSFDELTAFSLGQLGPPRLQAVEEHVRECRECCETLLELKAGDDTFVQLLRDARQDADASSGETADTLPERLAPSPLRDHPRYDLLEVLGTGGMGTVYRARHRVMERTVALKVISPQWVSKPGAIERFHREVKAAARLSHPNIVTAHDAEQAGDLHYLVMECVQGTDLSALVGANGPLSVTQACDSICQAAAGLQHAHDAGLVHRDIKPHNLMRANDGTIKILDFGLAALSLRVEYESHPDAPSHLTALGTVMGTPEYVSPEQIVSPQTADHRSDVYSLGATLYFLLAGRSPFGNAPVPDLLKDHQETNAQRLDAIRDGVPGAVADAVIWMMAKSADDRPQSVAQVIDILRPFADGRTESPSHTQTMVKSKGLRRNWWLAMAAAVAASITLAAIVDSHHVDVVEPDLGGPDTTSAVPQPAPDAAVIFHEMHFAHIPPGYVRMGTAANRKATPEERAHQVEITYAFDIGKFEVTQDEFARVMGRNPSEFVAESGQLDRMDRLPVENVSWEEAVAFCENLTALPEARDAGYVFRLPTEAEWEYVCRANSMTAYHFGDALDGAEANVNGEQPWGTQRPGPSLQRTAPVGSYTANAFGVHDMHGNVWEWCADWYQLDYYAQAPHQDPPGPATGTNRVVRGGAWSYGAVHARASARGQREPDYRDSSLGFRVVRLSIREKGTDE